MPQPASFDHLRGYALCSEPRSGTNFLCQLLESTGMLGHPRDWLNVRGMRAKVDPAYPADPLRQIERILGDGATANGVYGFKMFSLRFDEIERIDWTARLPNLRFIHLERHDLLGQAISDWRAVQTGQYRTGQPATGEARYDAREIGRRLADFAHARARWHRWFGRNGLTPLRLVYEDVIADPQAAADAVARLMGVDAPVPLDLAAVEVRPQRDAATRAWRERYLAEAGNLRRLDDDPLPRLRSNLRRLKRRLRGELL